MSDLHKHPQGVHAHPSEALSPSEGPTHRKVEKKDEPALGPATQLCDFSC